MDKITQQQRIVNYIRENGSATIRELFIYCNINSPSKRLSELRQLGMITEIRCEKENARGEKIRFKRYFLKGETNA